MGPVNAAPEPKASPDYQADKVVHLALYDPSKGKKILGFEYHTLEETVKDTLDNFKAKGWVA